MHKTTLIWFRRNLRLADNAVLQTAAARGLPAVAVFTPEMPSESGNPRRALFHCQAAQELARNLAAKGVQPVAAEGDIAGFLPVLARKLNAQSVLADEGYTPSETAKDNRIWRLLDEKGIAFERVNDRTVFAKADVMSEHGRAYTDFAAYKQAWLDAFKQRYAVQENRPSEMLLPPDSSDISFPPLPPESGAVLACLPPFADPDAAYPHISLPQHGGERAAQRQWRHFSNRLDFYPLLKDFPAKKATSQLSAYLAVGCLSPRLLAQQAVRLRAGAWLDNLIRRDFYMQLVFHHPEAVGQPLLGQEGVYRDNPEFFRRWTQGETGFPLIDAAMRCLKNSGSLSPVLRRIAAEFWCRTLQQDWRQGAAWFARQQTDDDEALNTGNWQAAAGLLSLSAPRAANPVIQAQQADPDGTFVRRYVPELAHLPKDLIHAPWLARADIDRHGYPLPLIGL